MRFGCCVPVEKYAMGAAAGYDYIEIPGWQLASLSGAELESLKDEMDRAGVPILRVNSYCSGKPAICGPAFDPEAARAYAADLMTKASFLGVEKIGIGAPAARRLPEGFDSDLADAQCAEFLKINCEEAAPYGIDILLEAIQPAFCNYLNDTAVAFERVKLLGIDNLHMVIDLYHMKNNGESLSDMGWYMDEAGHVHVSTTGPSNTRGLFGAATAAECGESFAAIKNAGYDGTVSIEPDAAAITPESLSACLDLMRRCAG